MKPPTTKQLFPKLNLSEHFSMSDDINYCSGANMDIYAYNYKESDQHNIEASEYNSKELSILSFYIINEHNVQQYIIPNMDHDYHLVQILPNDELVVINSVNHYRGSNDFDLNARIYDITGKLKREFTLGDHIQDIQTSKNGTIWTSYYDQAFMGKDPIGHSGLNCWNSEGQLLYEYNTRLGVSTIFDCYAMNVTSDHEVWLYYHTEFPLVKVKDHQVVSWWESPVKGSIAFTITKNLVLFQGGYDNRDEYELFELGNHQKMTSIDRFVFVDENNEPIKEARVIARGPFMHIIHEDKYYRVDIKELL